MAVFSSHRLGKRRWTLGLTLLASVIALGFGVALRQSISPSTIDDTSKIVLDYRMWASGGRLSAIAIVIAAWPRIIEIGVRMAGLNLAHFRAHRWRVAGWLLAIELMVGQDLPGKLLA